LQQSTTARFSAASAAARDAICGVVQISGVLARRIAQQARVCVPRGAFRAKAFPAAVKGRGAQSNQRCENFPPRKILNVARFA
jgi:hypothetical protein